MAGLASTSILEGPGSACSGYTDPQSCVSEPRVAAAGTRSFGINPRSIACQAVGRGRSITGSAGVVASDAAPRCILNISAGTWAEASCRIHSSHFGSPTSRTPIGIIGPAGHATSAASRADIEPVFLGQEGNALGLACIIRRIVVFVS